MAEDYKKAVLDRLKDAVILYCNERYIASLYMSGYVIEIGIKVEFERLSKIEINNQNKISGIIGLLSKNSIQSPLLLKKLLEEIQKINNKDTETLRRINVIFTPLSNNHDITEFLERLNDWKKSVEEYDFNTNDYDIKQHCGWKTSLRYGNESATNNSEQQDAKNALEMAIKFLEIICLSLNEEDMNEVCEYKNKFIEFINPNNAIPFDESEISSTEQTLNNEDYSHE